MVQRLTFRRTLSYNTSSNRRKIVKTPGGKLVYQHIGKAVSFEFFVFFWWKNFQVKAPKCGDTGAVLRGVKAGRPRQLAQYSKRQKTVSRAYGGSLSCKKFLHIAKTIKQFQPVPSVPASSALSWSRSRRSSSRSSRPSSRPRPPPSKCGSRSTEQCMTNYVNKHRAGQKPNRTTLLEAIQF